MSNDQFPVTNEHRMTNDQTELGRSLVIGRWTFIGHRALDIGHSGAAAPPRRGYVLMETMVALVVVSVGLAGVMRAIRMSLTAGHQAASSSIACQLAEQKLTELRVQPPAMAGTHDGDFGPDYPGYRWRTTVRAVDRETFHSALVEVFWTQQGRQQSLTLGSLIQLQTPGPP